MENLRSEPNNNEVKREQIIKFFEENEIDKLNFDTSEEAEAHVNLINSKYGDISFVAEDMGGFSVKFKLSHLGEGFPEYNKDSYSESDIDLNKEAA